MERVSSEEKYRYFMNIREELFGPEEEYKKWPKNEVVEISLKGETLTEGEVAQLVEILGSEDFKVETLRINDLDDESSALLVNALKTHPKGISKIEVIDSNGKNIIDELKKATEPEEFDVVFDEEALKKLQESSEKLQNMEGGDEAEWDKFKYFDHPSEESQEIKSSEDEIGNIELGNLEEVIGEEDIDLDKLVPSIKKEEIVDEEEEAPQEGSEKILESQNIKEEAEKTEIEIDKTKVETKPGEKAEEKIEESLRAEISELLEEDLMEYLKDITQESKPPSEEVEGKIEERPRTETSEESKPKIYKYTSLKELEGLEKLSVQRLSDYKASLESEKQKILLESELVTSKQIDQLSQKLANKNKDEREKLSTNPDERKIFVQELLTENKNKGELLEKELKEIGEELAGKAEQLAAAENERDILIGNLIKNKGEGDALLGELKKVEKSREELREEQEATEGVKNELLKELEGVKEISNALRSEMRKRATGKLTGKQKETIGELGDMLSKNEKTGDELLKKLEEIEKAGGKLKQNWEENEAKRNDYVSILEMRNIDIVSNKNEKLIEVLRDNERTIRELKANVYTEKGKKLERRKESLEEKLLANELEGEELKLSQAEMEEVTKKLVERIGDKLVGAVTGKEEKFDISSTQIEISLEDQLLTKNDVERLAGILKNKDFNLGVLRLKNCNLNDSDIKILMEALKTHPRNMQVLDFSGNAISDKAAAELANALYHSNFQQVEQVFLNDTQVSNKGIEELTEAVRSNRDKVKTLHCEGGLHTVAEDIVAEDPVAEVFSLPNRLNKKIAFLTEKYPEDGAIKKLVTELEKFSQELQIDITQQVAKATANGEHDLASKQAEKISNSPAMATLRATDILLGEVLKITGDSNLLTLLGMLNQYNNACNQAAEQSEAEGEPKKHWKNGVKTIISQVLSCLSVLCSPIGKFMDSAVQKFVEIDPLHALGLLAKKIEKASQKTVSMLHHQELFGLFAKEKPLEAKPEPSETKGQEPLKTTPKGSGQ